MKPTTRSVIAYAAVVVLLAAVAALYFSPHLMVDLAARLWACF
jgi:hypothetical protein